MEEVPRARHGGRAMALLCLLWAPFSPNLCVFTNQESLQSLSFKVSMEASQSHDLVSYWSCVGVLSCVRLFATPWTVACQAPLSMEIPRQEYWSRLPFPPPGDLPDPGIDLWPALGVSYISCLGTEPPGKPLAIVC